MEARVSPFGLTAKLPLYLQLSEWLEEQISSGKYATGARLPGDHELAKQFRVSVITVRAAMRALMEKHVIARYPGRGTFVTDSSRLRAVWSLGSIEDLGAIGLQSTLQIHRMGLEAPPQWAIDTLRATAGEKFYCFRTVRFAGDLPFIVTDIYLRRPIGTLIKDLDLQKALKAKKLVSALVEERSGLRIEEIKQTMSAQLADKKTARDLQVKVGTPLLVVDREYYAADRILLQLGRSQYRVDHHRYAINLKRSISK